MDLEPSALPLERSVSQQSAASVTSSQRSTSRHSRRTRRLASHVSSSASSVAASDKSLTSFPSFSPESPRVARSYFEADDQEADSKTTLDGADSRCRAKTVDDLMSTPSPKLLQKRQPARRSLFDDEPVTTQNIPGALHLVDDAHIERLIARHGAVGLVRQVASDLAQRDAQIAAQRRRADERERALRKIILECGLSNLELETRLRSVENEVRGNGAGKRRTNTTDSGALSDMMSDAMEDTVTSGSAIFGRGDLSNDATIRATSLSRVSSAENRVGTKGWKDYLFGGTSKKSSRASSINGDAAKIHHPHPHQPHATVIRNPLQPDKRPGLAEDLFSPPDNASVRSSSRASSINSSQQPQSGARKGSSSIASLALRLVAGGTTTPRDGEGSRGRANSANQSEAQRASSQTSNRTTQSSRAVSTQVSGPKALMAMNIRRPTPAGAAPAAVAAIAGPRGPLPDRWDTMVGSPPGSAGLPGARQESYGPVEMDTILPAEIQPPTLTHIYNNFPNSEYLTDRFGFIYDQRRKKRQRDAAARLAVNTGGLQGHFKKNSRGAEMLTNGRGANMSPISPDESGSAGSAGKDLAGDGPPDSPSSFAEVVAAADDTAAPSGQKHKRWQDYLKIATFPTELLSHTPSMSVPTLEVTEGTETPKSPGVGITADERGFLPSASAPLTATVDSETARSREGSIDVIAAESSNGGASAAGTAALLKEDPEPVKLLLQQLSELHDSLQREKTVRWNDFLRKVRAERRREGEAAIAREVAASEARYERPAVILPEAGLADGEMIGIAGLGNKGKVGRAKWNEFKTLVLSGIPVAYRAKIWSECSGATANRIPGYYEDLVAKPDGDGDDDPTVVAQIDMDIRRTLTDNIFFRKGPGVAKLRDVLLAYSRRNADVGYCQGMNLIAANLLLIMPSAEDAFWILTTMVENILPAGYYDQSLRASRADQQVLRQYVHDVLPRLSQHLDDLGIELEALTFQWFLSVFTDCLSAEALFRVWDVVLCSAQDGSTFLFQVALALLKLNEAPLLLCETPAAVYTYIGHQMTNHAISIDGLLQASEGLRRVVKREEVEARRDKALLAELERVREREERLAQLMNSKKAKKARSATETTASTTTSAAATNSITGELDVREPIPIEEQAGA